MWCRRPACKPRIGRQDACPTLWIGTLLMQKSIKGGFRTKIPPNRGLGNTPSCFAMPFPQAPACLPCSTPCSRVGTLDRTLRVHHFRSSLRSGVGTNSRPLPRPPHGGRSSLRSAWGRKTGRSCVHDPEDAPCPPSTSSPSPGSPAPCAPAAGRGARTPLDLTSQGAYTRRRLWGTQNTSHAT